MLSIRSLVGFADAFKSDFPCWCVGCGWVVGWCDCWFCNRCDTDDGDVEGVVFDGGSSQEFVGFGYNEFAWCEDLVEKGFVYVDAEK